MPLPSGINQPFDSSQAVKRQTKIQFLGGAPPPLPLSEAETSARVCMNQGALGVFGAYLELFASTVKPTNFVCINLIPNNGFASWNAEVEIASGLVGFEVAIIPNLMFWSSFPGVQSNESAATYYFPVPIIPIGTRLSSRVRQMQGVVANPLCIELVLIDT